MTATVLIAPDKFKGTLSAKAVASALNAGVSLTAHVREIPLADGGEGSIEAISVAGFHLHELNSSVSSSFTQPATIASKDGVFFIEAAEFVGNRQMKGKLDPLGVSTFTIGHAARAALDLGAHTIVLGVGGTYGTDGGVGFLMGLGAKFLAETSVAIPFGGGGLSILASADFSGLDPRLADAKIILASDVDSPLLGETGAAHLFSPQKGADPRQVEFLEQGLSHLVNVLGTNTKYWAKKSRVAKTSPGAGAGGGLGFAVLLIGGTRVSGAEFILDLLEIDEALLGCDLVITGEGRLDQQSLAGKLPVAIANRARRLKIPVIAVVGSSGLSADETKRAGISKVFALDQMDARCAHDPALSLQLLTQIGESIGRSL